MKLTKAEIQWLKHLQEILDSAPKSFVKKAKDRKISSYTIGDNDVVIYDSKTVDKYEETQRDNLDKCCAVQETDSELFTLMFPFIVESTAG